MTFTGSVSTQSNAVNNQYNTNEEGKTTPKKVNFDKDARGMEGGGTYPNYWSHKTPSGHNFIMDDSEGNETITIQHRSGSAIQMRPDGGVMMTTHNGKYEVVFGENRVTISGAHDITVKGDTSLRCYGDYNVTCHKDYNLTVLGNMNVTAKNLNRSIRGTIDTEAKTYNKRVEGPITVGTQGSYAVTAKADMSMVTKGKLQAVAGKDLGIHAKGNMVAESGKDMYQHSAGEYHGTFYSLSGVGSSLGSRKYGAIGPTGGNVVKSILVDSAGMHTKIARDHMFEVNGKVSELFDDDHSHSVGGNHKKRVTGTSSETVTSGNKITTVSQGSIQHTATAGSVDIRAPAGTSTFAGGVTNINSITGVLNMAAAAGGINLESIGGLLNLNGGIITQIASALGLNLPFNIGSASSADKPPELQGIAADAPTEEPDASSEIDSWQ